MKRRLAHSPSRMLCGLILAVLTLPMSARGQDASSAIQEGEADADELFVVPTGNAKRIQAFMQKLAAAEAVGETKAEQLEYAKRVMRAMVDATQALLDAKPNGRQVMEAHQYRIKALSGLVQFGDPDAEAALAKAIDVARNHELPGVVAAGWQAHLQLVTGKWRRLDEPAKRAFLDEIVAQIKSGDPQRVDASIVAVASSSLERIDAPFVAALLEATLPVLKASKNSQVRIAVKEANLEGLQRRMNLLGNPMEISGTLLTGKKVDWDSYRGKVVLVDFWATWCGPCRAEVPNLLEMYAAYHDQGFEVLGVSLDQTPEDAHKYIEEMNLPWDSIFPKSKGDRSWNHPLAKYYGISGIPTAILVGKDGKVVHMNARGPYLRQQLELLLGKPAAAAGAGEPEATPNKTQS